MEFSLTIRDVSPGPDFTRLTGQRLDGLADGFHTGGAWLSPDGNEVWKPTDGRPFANADCHTETLEAVVLAKMTGLPAFPANWRIETANGRRFIVRRRAAVLGRDIGFAEFSRADALLVEAGLRQLNARYWAIGDEISVAIDPDSGEPFILDLSAAHRETPPLPPADDDWRFRRWLEQIGQHDLLEFRKQARRVIKPALSSRWILGDGVPGWPGREWRYVYAAPERIDLPRAHYVEGDGQLWLVTPEPLDDDTVERCGLTWGWSPLNFLHALHS